MSFMKGAKVPALIAISSFILGVITWIAFRPWTEDLGPSFSPARIALVYAICALTLLIPGIMCMLLFIRNEKWLAPPGRYVPGVRYAPFSTYTLTAAAIVAAIYAVGGFPTGVNIDLPALITAFSATYFGSVVCFLAFIIGFFVRWAIGGATWLAIAMLVPVVAFIDGGVWAINGFIYWYFTRKEGIRYSFLRVVIAIILMVLVHIFGWLFVYAATLNPGPAAIAYVAFAFSTWYTTAIVFVIVGSLIGESIYRSRLAVKSE